MFVLSETEFASRQIVQQFTFVNKAAASVLHKFDVTVVDMGVECRLTASKNLAGFLDSDQLVRCRGWHPFDDILDGRRYDWSDDVTQ